MRRVAQLFVVLLVVAVSPFGAAQEWTVSADHRRQAKLADRYERLFLANPRPGPALSGLIDTLGTGAALDRLIDRTETRAASSPDSVKLWLALGHLRQARGDSAGALVDFRRAIRLAPANVDAHIALAEALREAGQPDAAKAAYEAALEATASPREQRSLLRRLVDIALASGRDEDAVGWFERLVELAPRDADLRVEYADTLARVEALETAVAQYQAAIELVGRNGKRRAEILRHVGELQLRRSRPRHALQALREALSLTSRKAWLRHELYALIVEAHRDLGRTQEIYEELTHEWARPDYSDAITLANLAEELGRDADVVRWLRMAMKRDAHALEPRSRLILRLSRQGKTDEVDRLYREIFRLEPDRIGHRLDFASWLFFAQRRPSDAIDLLVALESETKEVSELIAIADTWQQFGLADRSFAVLQRVFDSHPSDVGAIEALGTIQAKLGRIDEARATWLGLLDADLEPLAAHLRIAAQLQTIGDWEGVIVNIEAAVRLAPELPDLRRRLAQAFESAGRWDDAIEVWEEMYVEHGAVFAAERLVQLARFADVTELLARWEEQRRREPSVAKTLFVARLREASGGRFTGWVALVEEIFAIDPGTLESRREQWAWIEAARLLAEAQEDDGAYQLAANTWIRLGESFGRERSRAFRRVAVLSWSVGDVDRRQALIQRALEAAPDEADVQTHAGYFWSEKGDVDRAIGHLARAIELAPNGFDVHFELARLLAGVGRKSEARDVLLRVVAEDWSGVRASAAALTALDLADGDEEVLELEHRLRQLGPRVREPAFWTMMVAVYTELFVYGRDPDAAFLARGESALPILVAAMQSSSDDETERAAALLRLYPNSAVVDAAHQRWTNPQRFNQEMLIVLAQTRLPRAAPLLMDAVRHPNPEIELGALAALHWTPNRSSAADLLAIVRHHADEQRRERALIALAAVPGTDVLAELLAATSASRPTSIRRAAASALGYRSEAAAVRRLDELLGDSEPRVSVTAAWSLAKMRTDASARALFCGWWSNESARRASAAAGLRAFLGLRSAVLGAEKREYLALPRGTYPEKPAQNEMIETISQMRHAAALAANDRLDNEESRPLVLGDLVKIAEEQTDTEERHEVLRVLIGQLRPRLRNIAQNDTGPTLLGASLLLPRAQKSEDIPVVLAAARRLGPEGRSAVVRQLARFEWKVARGPLLAAARSDDPHQRAAALETLAAAKGAHDDVTVRSITIELTRDADRAVRSAAVAALGRLGGDNAVDVLVESFENADLVKRLEIVEALRTIDSERAGQAVRKLEIVNHTSPCNGDPADLTELLRDDCVEMLGAGF